MFCNYSIMVATILRLMGFQFGFKTLGISFITHITALSPSMYAMEYIGTFYHTLNRVMKYYWANFVVHASNTIHHAEDLYHKNETMAVLINQVMFFMLCDRWWCPADRLTGLYSLLFYNVIGYLFHYARHLLSLHDYTPIVRVSEHTNIRHLAMTATKIVLDLTKVVTFVITGVFMLLVFGLEQGLEYFSPTWSYIVVTTLYFTATEPRCQKELPVILIWMQLDALENLELFWTPVLLRILSSFASILMIATVWYFTDGGWMLILSSSYINVFLCLRDMGHHMNILIREKECLQKYRYATRDELNEKDDVCAVCLQTMKLARITPCKHMFHSDCLRRCLKEHNKCPLCKQNL